MDIGRVLSTMPPIVENIFKHLNRQDLDSCSTVCELWKSVAETERKSRQDIFWFLQRLKCSVHDKVHTESGECSLDIGKDIEKEMIAQFKDLKFIPTVCLVFATNYLINDFESFFPSFEYPPQSSLSKRLKENDVLRNRVYLEIAMRTALSWYVPKQCKTTFCVAPGIIGSHPDCVPFEIDEVFAISGLMIPAVPGFEVYNFPIDDWKSDISKLIPKKSIIKCLLIFRSPYNSSCYNRILQSCLLKENCKIAVGGALIDYADSHSGSVVAFCGESVDAASVFLMPSDKESELERKLKRFQETGLLQYRCFAFMFAAVRRGCESNLESRIFHQLYPTIPLVGVFGKGEIGIEYLPNVPSIHHVLCMGKLARCKKRYLHSFTTIIVLVSVKL